MQDTHSIPISMHIPWLGQQHRRRRTPHLSRNTARLHLGHHRVRNRGPASSINLKSTQQLITAERGQVNITQLLPGSGEMAEREPNR